MSNPTLARRLVVIGVIALAAVALIDRVARLDRSSDRSAASLAGRSDQAVKAPKNPPSSTSLAKNDEFSVPILMYHYVRQVDEQADPVGYKLSVPAVELTRQLTAYKKAGYSTITPEQFLAGNFNQKSLMLTFDDGYEDFYQAAFPVLRQLHMTATVFVISGFIDDRAGRYLKTAEIRQLADAGISIGSHSVHHLNLKNLAPNPLDKELTESKNKLEKITGKKIIAIAYPSGQYNDTVVKAARLAGYQLGVTTRPGLANQQTDRLALPRVRVSGGEPLKQILEAMTAVKSPR